MTPTQVETPPHTPTPTQPQTDSPTLTPSSIKPPFQTPGFLIAGTASSTGKTTVTLALLAALRRRSLNPQPFKCGPDFLDPTHHSRIAGRAARNLDTWMLSPKANRAVFTEACIASPGRKLPAAGILLVEAMMGLFDGADALTDRGSSAEIAKLLNLPVILVLDASTSARSIASVVLGFETFDPQLPLAGIILNRVAGPHHFAFLAPAIEARCATPILGWLPAEPRVAIPERHLGLHPATLDPATLDAEIDLLANFAETHLNLEAILELARTAADPVSNRNSPSLVADSSGPAWSPAVANPAKVRIGIPRDPAFTFYYEDNLDLLRLAGADLVPFSPISDTHLPSGLSALYLGGGYPELHAEALSRNTSMLASIRAFASTGAPIYAECGGMLYLGRRLRTLDGATYPMAAVLPLEHEMTPHLENFGYVTATCPTGCLLGPAGTTLRGHSFHYSRPVPSQVPTPNPAYEVLYSISGRTEPEGIAQGNLLASYVHLHFRTDPAAAASFVEAARAFKPPSLPQPFAPQPSIPQPEEAYA